MKSFLLSAIEASWKAGDEILRVYQSDFDVESKKDNSPLTLADKKSHDIIFKILSETQIPILSEEGKEISYNERQRWPRLWIVDPLDGTKEFVKRNGEFTVNIALVENGIPILGVIYVPVKKDLYFGQKNIGAFKAAALDHFQFSDLEQLLIKSKKLPEKLTRDKFTVVASRSHQTETTMNFIDGLKKKYGEVETVSAGSSLKICLVAEGVADIYPRFGPTMEWDTAAGQAILESAGGKLIDAQTNLPMRYNRESLKNNSFIAVLSSVNLG
jgi:3'(2'), 5'-bisphosphate nucleotidase